MNDHIVLKENRYVLVVHYGLRARDQNPKGSQSDYSHMYMVNIVCSANGNGATIRDKSGAMPRSHISRIRHFSGPWRVSGQCVTWPAGGGVRSAMAFLFINNGGNYV